jgi:hypothetical protein
MPYSATLCPGKRWISTFEMTPEELTYYARHPDTFFGGYQRQPQGLQTMMDMYDFFAESFGRTPRNRLIELLTNYPDQKELGRLSQNKLVEILTNALPMVQCRPVSSSRPERRSMRSGVDTDMALLQAESNRISRLQR